MKLSAAWDQEKKDAYKRRRAEILAKISADAPNTIVNEDN